MLTAGRSYGGLRGRHEAKATSSRPIIVAFGQAYQLAGFVQLAQRGGHRVELGGLSGDALGGSGYK